MRCHRDIGIGYVSVQSSDNAHIYDLNFKAIGKDYVAESSAIRPLIEAAVTGSPISEKEMSKGVS